MRWAKVRQRGQRIKKPTEDAMAALSVRNRGYFRIRDVPFCSVGFGVRVSKQHTKEKQCGRKMME